MLFNYAGEFEKVPIYETSLFSEGTGLTIPNFGIFVSEGAFSKELDHG